MTASAPIAGTLRAIPDAASAPPPDSGVSAHANFRSVLEQYHLSRESAADADSEADHTAPQKKQKDSDTTPSTLPAKPASNPAGNPIVPQAVTPPVEPPRLILPFTASINLRQDTTASPDDASALDSTTATAPTPQTSGSTSGAAATLLTPVIFSSTFDLRSLPLVSDSKSLPIPTATQPKIQTKGQAKLSKESAPSQDAAAATPAPSAPSDPSTPILPVATSSTLQPATTAAQTSSTASEAPEPVPVPAPAFTVDRRSAYQFHSLPERPAESLIINRASQESQNTSDPTPAAAAASANVTAPIPVTNNVEPAPPVRLPAGAPPPRQTAPASQNNSSAVTQDSSTAAATDPTTAMPPVTERAEDTTAVPPPGSLAFAARLTPTEETPAAAPDANRTADSQLRSQITLQTPATARQIISEADAQSDAHNGESASPSSDQEKMSERFAKLETLLPQTHAATADLPPSAPDSHASSTSPLSVAARMDQVPVAPPAPSSGNHDITIRIPDATTDQGTAVRFIERAGEVHVSVRTSDTEMAQTLRGGLNDLVTRLEDGGIRTQVWQPGADASTSQNNSQQPSADPDGSNGRQYSSGSHSEQESKQQNKPRWVEELEDSIGSQNSKETPQLWQA